MLLKLCDKLIGRLAGFGQHDERFYDITPELVGARDGGALGHSVVLVQYGLYL